MIRNNCGVKIGKISLIHEVKKIGLVINEQKTLAMEIMTSEDKSLAV